MRQETIKGRNGRQRVLFDSKQVEESTEWRPHYLEENGKEEEDEEWEDEGEEEEREKKRGKEKWKSSVVKAIG